MSQIPSKLIIYQAHRFTLSRQNNIKYGFFSPNLKYSATRSPKALRKRIIDLPKKDYINMISYTLIPVKSESNYFIRFITRISSIKNLSLTLLPANLQGSIAEQETRKTLKKIFKVCSRAKRLHIIIMPRSLKIPISFKYFRLLKPYKNLTCSLWSPSDKPFEKLAKHIKSQEIKQNNNSFRLIADPDYLINRNFDLDSFANSLEIFDSKAQNLSLSCSETDMNSLLSFARRTFKLRSLIELSLELELSAIIVNIFDIIQENKLLQELRLQFTSQGSFVLLQKPNFESVTSLHLTFEKFENAQPFSAFLSQLTSCSARLSSLYIIVKRSEGLNDAVLSSLIESLAELKDKLRCFHFQTENPKKICTKLTTAKIIDFYTQIGNLKNLKELDLAFPHYQEASSEEALAVLCESLKDLTQLEYLHLNMKTNNITDASIIQLANNALPNLMKLNSLMLSFAGGFSKPISGNCFNQILASLANLKYLSHLELNIKCEDVDEKCARQLISEFSKIRGLNYLRLYLEIAPDDASIQEYLRQNMVQVERKIEAITSIKS